MKFLAFAFISTLLLSACTTPIPRDTWFETETLIPEIQEIPLKKKIAQMLLVGFRGTELTLDSSIYRDLTELGIGGVLLFTRNIISREQLTLLTRDLQNSSPVKLFIAIDQEGGRVNRLRTEYGFPSNLSAREMSAGTYLTMAQAGETAALLAGMGINLNLAPCVDLDINPDNPVIGAFGRSFSSDPETVITHASIWIEAHSRRGILSCIKHFPGHGSSSFDTHYGWVDVTNLWQEAELLPYSRLIAAQNTLGPIMVMASHVVNANLDPKNPASLSHAILTGLLRNELGFEGVIVSDAMDMMAITAYYGFAEALEKAINAGVDILCLPNNSSLYDPGLAQRAVDIIYNYVLEGIISEQRIEESWNRIMALKRYI